MPFDCVAIKRLGNATDGVYTIYPDGNPKQVYCDMTTDNGGWTVRKLKVQGHTTCTDGVYTIYPDGIPILLVIRFMADLLRKYRGSIVIMVGRGGAEPHYVHN